MQDIALPVQLVAEVHPVGTVLLSTSLEVMELHPSSSISYWKIWLRALLAASVLINIVFELYSIYHLRGYYARRNSATWVWIIAGGARAHPPPPPPSLNPPFYSLQIPTSRCGDLSPVAQREREAWECIGREIGWEGEGGGGAAASARRYRGPRHQRAAPTPRQALSVAPRRNACAVLVYVSVIAELIMYVITAVRLNRLTYDPATYFSTHCLSYLVLCRRSIVAFTSFMVWFRLLKCEPGRARSPTPPPTPSPVCLRCCAPPGPRF